MSHGTNHYSRETDSEENLAAFNKRPARHAMCSGMRRINTQNVQYTLYARVLTGFQFTDHVSFVTLAEASGIGSSNVFNDAET